MMCYSVMTRVYSDKEIPSSPNRSRTYDLPITSSDALPLSYRRLMGAKAIKLGSWDKRVLPGTINRKPAFSSPKILGFGNEDEPEYREMRRAYAQ